MFIRKKPNKSGLISIQVIDKSHGNYKVIKTIGSSKDPLEIETLVLEAKRYVQTIKGLLEIDFTNFKMSSTDEKNQIPQK